MSDNNVMTEIFYYLHVFLCNVNRKEKKNDPHLNNPDHGNEKLHA